MPSQTRGEPEVPWGPNSSIPLDLPDAWPTPKLLEPDLSNPIANYEHALQLCLSRPNQQPPLAELARPSRKIAIVVDDPTRWTPIRQALPLVLATCESQGVDPRDISISVGVGRHQAVDPATMRRHLGDSIVDRYTTYSPPVDELSQYVDLGTTPQGVPVRVFRPVAQADLRILVGSVLPHLQAGFGGGYKLIFPGCSHRSTLSALHRQGLGHDSATAESILGGNVATNPMRTAIRAAASQLPGDCFSISHVLGMPGQVLHISAGSVDHVQSELSDHARNRFQHATAPADIAIVANAPFPGDPMMSFKVLLNHRAAVRPGGILVGLFWTDLAHVERSLPMNALRTIAASGRPGGWAMAQGLRAADRIAAALKIPARFMIHWARELVVDHRVLVFSPSLHALFGSRLGPVELFADLPVLWKRADRIRRGKSPKSVIFPIGGLTYATKL